MKNPSFIRRVEYHTLLDEKAPISFYDLYDDGNHRFAMITFYNNSKNTISSFKIKFTFYTKNKDYLSTAVYQLKPKDFRVHHNFEISDPLIFPKDADGFNYEIFDVVYPDHNQLKKEKLRIKLDNVDQSRLIVPKKENIFAKWKWIGILGIGVVALSMVAIPVANTISTGSPNNYPDNNNNNGTIIVNNNGYEMIIEKDSQTTGYVITGIASAPSSGTLYIESYMGGYEITRIDKNVFSGLFISEVRFDNSNLTVSERAFNGSSVTTVRGSVGSIGQRAFENSKINMLQLDSVTEIGNYAFYQCTNLNYVNVNNCKSIGQYAFANDYNLYDVSLSVSEISTYAFSDCTSLSSVTIKDCSRIGNYAFQNCWNITYCSVNDGFKLSGSAFEKYVDKIMERP